MEEHKSKIRVLYELGAGCWLLGLVAGSKRGGFSRSLQEGTLAKVAQIFVSGAIFNRPRGFGVECPSGTFARVRPSFVTLTKVAPNLVSGAIFNRPKGLGCEGLPETFARLGPVDEDAAVQRGDLQRQRIVLADLGGRLQPRLGEDGVGGRQALQV